MLLIAWASLSGSPGINGPFVPGAGGGFGFSEAVVKYAEEAGESSELTSFLDEFNDSFAKADSEPEVPEKIDSKQPVNAACRRKVVAEDF